MVVCMNYLVLLLISVLPVFLICLFVYNKDKNKEPIGLVLQLFFAGIGSFFVTLIITFFLSMFFPSLLSEQFSFDLVSLFFHVFFGVALVEEFSKWIFVYNIGFNNREFDQVYDMIVYAVFVSLGFACLENIFYVFQHGLYTGIIRALLAVPGHACDGVFMGYYLSIAKLASIHGNDELKKHNIFMSILIPTLLHGFYDYCLFSKIDLFICLFFIFIIILYIVSIGKINKMSLIQGKIRYNYNFCPHCGHRVETDFCPMCGNKND